MLREFLSKIFSPPHAAEGPRVSSDDFERLKRKIHVADEENEEVCETNHGPLSLHHQQHTPLSRSVSMHASSAAYDRYLQRNAAKADNWSEFEDLLHPKIEPLEPGAKPASFLTPEEEAELQNRPPAPVKPQISPFLKYEPPPEPSFPVTASVVQSVERLVKKHTAGKAKPFKFETPKYMATKIRTIGKELSARYCKSWLLKHSRDRETVPDALRELATSSLPAVRAGIAANERIPYDCLWTLAHDPDAKVRLHLAKNPNCTIELLETLRADLDERVSTEATRILKSITS